MKWLLVHRDNTELATAWRRYFGDVEDAEIVSADICSVKADAVVSPANSFGFMDGGLDHALSLRFGWDLQRRLQQDISNRPLKELLVGEAVLVPTNDADIPWLLVAPTMRVPMKLRQTINPYLAMKAILVTAISATVTPPIGTVAIPGLGTGVGGLDPNTSALQMWTAYQEVLLRTWSYPPDFGEAQLRHLSLNPHEIMLWD